MNKKILVVLLFILIIAGLFYYKKAAQPPVETNPAVGVSEPVAVVETFAEVFAHKLPVLAELGSESCIPCKQMRPIVLALKKEFAGRMIVDIVDVNMESAKTNSYGKFFNLRVIPVQLLISADGKLLWSHEGSLPEAELRAVIAERTGLK